MPVSSCQLQKEEGAERNKPQVQSTQSTDNRANTLPAIVSIPKMVKDKSFLMTWAGFALTMASGFISAAASGLIIYIVLKSKQRLSTTYHRIMTIMSVFDFVASFAAGLSTIPMPKDMIYKFDGPILGNLSTCKAQGYITFLGAGVGGALNLCLAWYYVFSITLQVKSETIRKRLEPIFYILSASIGIFVPTLFLSLDFLNAHPFFPHCTLAPYPFPCDQLVGTILEGMECDSSETSVPDGLVIFSIGIIGAIFLGIVLAMIIIIWSVIKNETQIQKTMAATTATPEDIGDLEQDATERVESNGKSIKNLRFTRIIVVQALMYIGAFFLTWVFSIVGILKPGHPVIETFQNIFRNLQGLWNMIIFVYHRVYMVRERDNGKTFWMALKIAIIAPEEVPEMYLSNIDMLENDEILNDEGDVLGRPESEKDTQTSPKFLRSVGSEYDSELFTGSTQGRSADVSSTGIVSNNMRHDEGTGEMYYSKMYY